MSNYVTITPTKFTDERSGEVSLGYRAADEAGAAFNNTWDSIPDDDLVFLAKVFEDLACSPYLEGLVEYLIENEKGIYIGNVAYGFDEIKATLEAALKIQRS